MPDQQRQTGQPGRNSQPHIAGDDDDYRHYSEADGKLAGNQGQENTHGGGGALFDQLYGPGGDLGSLLGKPGLT